MEKKPIHRLISTPKITTSVCGAHKPGDILAARPFPITCLECLKLERP